MERGREEKESEEKLEEKESVERRSRRAKGKVAKNCVFLMLRGSGGSKSRLTKAAGAEPSGEGRSKIACRCGAQQIWKSK